MKLACILQLRGFVFRIRFMQGHVSNLWAVARSHEFKNKAYLQISILKKYGNEKGVIVRTIVK